MTLSPSHHNHGYFDIRLGFALSGLHFLHLHGGLGPERILERPMNAEAIALSSLAVVALALLVTFTGGVAYLTAVEWRDRRRREKEQRDR